MRRVTASELARVMQIQADIAEAWCCELNAAMRRYGIDAPARQAAFLAQIGHESGSLRYVIENLNYSAEALRRVWPSRFDSVAAVAYERRPEAIANRVYADRMGNGPESSGDGWRYRGRGLIQITGKDNYRQCGLALGVDLLAQPELLQQNEYAALSAAWYWSSRQLNLLADTGAFDAITLRINGGTNGKADRRARFERAKKIIR